MQCMIIVYDVIIDHHNDNYHYDTTLSISYILYTQYYINYITILQYILQNILQYDSNHLEPFPSPSTYYTRRLLHTFNELRFAIMKNGVAARWLERQYWPLFSTYFPHVIHVWT